MKNSLGICLQLFVDLIPEIWQVWNLDLHCQASIVRGQYENPLSILEMFVTLATVTFQPQVSVLPGSSNDTCLTSTKLGFVLFDRELLNREGYYLVGPLLKSLESALWEDICHVSLHPLWNMESGSVLALPLLCVFEHISFLIVSGAE